MGRPALDEKDKSQKIKKTYSYEPNVVFFLNKKKKFPGAYLSSLVRADHEFHEFMENKK